RLQAAWRHRERGPDIKVYHPADVDRLRQERRPSLAPFVLGADVVVAAAANRHRGPGSTIAPQFDPAKETAGWLQLVDLAQEFVSRTSRTLPHFATLDEASAESGLSKVYLRRLVDEGR